MQDIRIATAQFEARDRDPHYNLGRVADLTARAAKAKARVVAFHECCLCGYTFLQPLTRDELLDVAEFVPDGESVRALGKIAKANGVYVLAGLLEKDEADALYNTQVCVNPSGEIIAKHRKLHAFVNPHLSSGDSYTLFEIDGIPCGTLICYDNNLPENVRATAILGAEIIFMPHVTCGTPSPMPGRGVIPREVWERRDVDPVRCRQEFLGPKGRGWLMKWLPARAFENGIYAVFSNPVGVDHDTVKNGNSMIIDPYGEVLVESNALGDDVVIGLCTAEKTELAGGRRYLRARRPELYGPLMTPPPGGTSRTEPGWQLERPGDAS